MAVLDRVDTRNRRIDVGRVVLLPLAGLLWAFGWLTGKTWLVIAWVWAALKLGWSDARGTPHRR